MAFDDDLLTSARREVLQTPMLPLTMVNSQFITITNEIPRGQKAFTFKTMTQYGVAQIMTTRTTSVPLLGDAMEENLVRVYPMKMGFEVTDDEIELSAGNSEIPNPFTSRLLQTRESLDQLLDIVGYSGTSGTTLKGIANFPGITTVVLPADGTGASAAWSTKTPDKVVRDLNLIANTMSNQTAYTVTPNRIVMGTAAAAHITNNFFNDGTRETIYTVFMRNQSLLPGGGITSIVAHPVLDTLGDAGVGRIVCYNTNSRYNKFHIPQGGGFTDSGIQRRGDLRVVECKQKTAGVEIQKIKELVYANVTV